MTTLEQPTIDDFTAHLHGEVLQPGDTDYDEARTVWNAMIDRRPALIARCTSADDVVRAVNFARDSDLIVSVRGGSHNIGGSAVCDDGLMIDLSPMRHIDVDAKRRRVTVEPGCTLAEVDAATQAHGLALPLGINSTTGVAGLTLGGGFGWLSRKYGMTVDSLVGADIVTADGKQVHASATSHPDLFWGMRGGGGNFGVVTRFEFELHPVGPDLLSGLIVFPFDQARTVLEQFARFTETMPDELSVWMVTRKAPPLPFLPSEAHGQEVVILALCYAGEPAAADATAYSSRDAQYVMNVHCRWKSEVDDARCIAWAREFFSASQPYASGGAYVNFLTGDEKDRVAFAYGPTWQRLRAVKRKYDPRNLFRMNQNIVPE